MALKAFYVSGEGWEAELESHLWWQYLPPSFADAVLRKFITALKMLSGKKQHREVEDKLNITTHLHRKRQPPDHVELQFLNCLVQHCTAGPKDNFPALNEIFYMEEKI